MFLPWPDTHPACQTLLSRRPPAGTFVSPAGRAAGSAARLKDTAPIRTRSARRWDAGRRAVHPQVEFVAALENLGRGQVLDTVAVAGGFPLAEDAMLEPLNSLRHRSEWCNEDITLSPHGSSFSLSVGGKKHY